MARCQICGKRGRIGRVSRHRRGVASHKFSKRAPKKSRRFGANLQKTTFYVGGLKMTMILCARCLKTMRKAKPGRPAANSQKTMETKKEMKQKTKEKKLIRTRKPAVKKTPIKAKKRVEKKEVEKTPSVKKASRPAAAKKK